MAPNFSDFFEENNHMLLFHHYPNDVPQTKSEIRNQNKHSLNVLRVYISTAIFMIGFAEKMHSQSILGLLDVFCHIYYAIIQKNTQLMGIYTIAELLRVFISIILACNLRTLTAVYFLYPRLTYLSLF